VRIDEVYLARLQRRRLRVGIWDETEDHFLERGFLTPVILVALDGQALTLLPLLELERPAAYHLLLATLLKSSPS
jgi:hypothetical protein